MKKLIAIAIVALLLAAAAVVLLANHKEEIDYSADDWSDDWPSRPIPAKFDLRSVDTTGDGIGNRCYVTPVKLQNPYGTCWGFAAIAAAEISLLGSVYDYDPEAYKWLDLSEKQLAYYSHTVNEKSGEGLVPGGDTMQDIYTGGAPFMATTTFAQGIGPSDESSNPLFEYHGNNLTSIQRYFEGSYQPYSYSDNDDWTMPEELRFYQDYILKESIILPDPAISTQDSYIGYNAEATELIKKQLLQKRGVEIAFHADTSSPNQDLMEDGQYLATRTWAHYTWDFAQPNHAVTIIGWDDSYPKENFVASHQPESNGAWLVKNSWGSGEEEFPNKGPGSWGILVQKTDDKGNPVFDENGDPVMVHSGYFWISYYDRSLKSPEALVFESAVAPDEINQYDYMPVSAIQVTEAEGTAMMANVFQADHTQIMNAISCQTSDRNTSVKYRIYLLPDDFENPDDGLLAAEGEVSFEYGGFHKIGLSDKGLLIQDGQRYSVVLTMVRENGTTYFNSPVGVNIPGISVSKVVLGERQSFLSNDGEWVDYKVVADELIKKMGGFEGVLFFDNFPIKSYSHTVTGDMSAHVRVSPSSISKVSGFDTAYASLSFEGPSTWKAGNPNIEWGVVKGYEGIVSITPQKDGSQLLIKAVDNGRALLYVDVEEYGITVFDVSVTNIYPAKAAPKTMFVEYTGEAQEIGLDVTTKEGVLLEKDLQYKVRFINNVKCGVAKAEVTGIGEFVNPDDPSPVYTYFAITPSKAEIASATREGDTLKVVVKDLWSTGISLYTLEYRQQGADGWTTVKIENGSTEAQIKGIGDGKYEVRVCAVLDTTGIEDKSFYIAPIYAGEYSDTVTV